jgi:hypothetical protein
MAWEIRYNGFGTSATNPETESDWYAVTVESYAATPVYADDGISKKAFRHSLRGTAIIRERTEAEFFATINRATDAFGPVGEALYVASDAYTSGDDLLYVFDPGTDTATTIGFPRADITVNRVAGTLAAFVGFSIEWETAVAAPDTAESSVLTHWWSQQWSQDEVGLWSWTVNGELVVSLEALGAGDEFSTNPDAFRELVYPRLPPNFRHEASQFAVSPSGDALIYSITAKEHARPIPSPARRGKASFTWRRDAGSAASLLGIKVFEAELEGDANAGRNELLAAAVRTSLNRIVWGGPGADRIISVEVTEDDAFSRNIVRLSVVAQAIGSAVPFTITNPVTRQRVSLGTPLVGALDGLDPARRPNAYGAALVRGVRRGIVGTYEAVSKAEYEGAAGAAEQVYTYDDAGVGTILTTPVVGGAETDFITKEHGDAQYQRVTAQEAVSPVYNRHLFLPADPAFPAIPIQRSAPLVRIYSRVTMVRLRKAPEKIFLAVPEGGVVKFEDWKVELGGLDANNNRTFVAVFERVVELSTTATNGGVFPTQSVSIPGFGTVPFTSFTPSFMALPGDPRTESPNGIRSRSVFDPHPRHNPPDDVFQFGLPAGPPYGVGGGNPGGLGS